MRVRAIEAIRAGWGIALLSAPRQVLGGVHGVEVDTTAVVVARVLGARHVVQALLSGVEPSPEVLAMGSWVDAAHAASAVGLAAADPSRARAGLVDAAIATSFSVAGWHDVGRFDVQSERHDRRRDAMARWTLRRVPFGRGFRVRAATARGETPKTR